MRSKHLENPSFWMKDTNIFVLGHTNSCSFGQYGGRIFSLHTKRGRGPDLSVLCQVLLFGHKRPQTPEPNAGLFEMLVWDFVLLPPSKLPFPSIWPLFQPVVLLPWHHSKVFFFSMLKVMSVSGSTFLSTVPA